ncbi:MAG: hypothetical protein KIC89_21730 [Acetobacteraceae bacterium]|nr:hypothetical protein [Acetobacteraceae bacterium]
MDEQPPTQPTRLAGAEEILRHLAEQQVVLRQLGEQLAALVRLLTPAPREEPGTAEMLRTVVAHLGEQMPMLRDLEGHALNLARELPRMVAHEVVLAQRYGER